MWPKAINPLKDVDGLTNQNLIKLINKEDGLVTCTTLGIINLLDYYKIEINTNITIVGRSHLVGLPLFHLLLNRNATITLTHSKTKDLKKHTLSANILIVAAGVKDFRKGRTTAERVFRNNRCLIENRDPLQVDAPGKRTRFDA